MLASMQAWYTQDAGLWSLFAGSFLAATLLPFSSEVLLFAAIKLHPDITSTLVAVATIGNSLGGATNYLIGRFIPHRRTFRHEDRVRRYGAPVLLLAWAPVIGDPLCVCAGWLRLNWWHCLACMAAGKGMRYMMLAGLI